MKYLKCMLVVCLLFSLMACAPSGGAETDDAYVPTADEVAFKEKYEGVNGHTFSDGYTAYEITIPEKNNAVMLTDDTILDVLESGNNVIYFGFEDCPWCRRMLNPLIDAALSQDKPIYVYDFKEARDAYYEVKKGNEDLEEAQMHLATLYKSIIEIVGHTVADTFEDLEAPRISAPTVFGVVNGEVIDINVGVYIDYTDHTVPLTEEEYELMTMLFESMYENVSNGSLCSADDGC